VFLSILFTRAATNIPHELAKNGVQLPPGSFDLNNTSGLSKLPPNVRHPILVGFSDSMDSVFLVGALVLVIGVVLSIMMKEVPLRTMSGQQARAAAEQAAGAAPADVSSVPPAEPGPLLETENRAQLP
jgi:hypothetical protein